MNRSSPLPAAQYLRMSTVHQQYSLENQAAAVQSYASTHGFEIVKTYSDGAVSGISFGNRPGLNRLLQDVIAGGAPFNAVMVYDVSRWGRFQDLDEAAHYEFLCKRAHIPVHYCAETFANDDSIASAIMKSLKRTIAAEYSRELGIKVFAAEKRWAAAGFKQGGTPGYGLGRVMVSSDGTRKQQLANGEVKCLQSDRVVLVPGPAEEVACVREIFRLLVEERKTPGAITRELNRHGLQFRGSPWSHQNVYRILQDPKYAGCNVWNRCSRRLGGPQVRHPKSEWIIKWGAFEPVVDPQVFNEAQRILAERTCAKSDEQLLAALRTLLAEKGKLSHEILPKTPGAPSPAGCAYRFGSLRRAFELAGYSGRRAGSATGAD